MSEGLRFSSFSSVVALQDRARNEARDLYDLWSLTTRAGIDIGDLIEAITENGRF